MHSRKRSLAILICLFLISFKVAAGSIFVDAAIERVQMHHISFASQVSDQGHHVNDPADGGQQSHTLFLMSHVTANISDVGIAVHLPTISEFKFLPTGQVLFTQNFPDSAFKPPKA
jgi:hypothetical protein